MSGAKREKRIADCEPRSSRRRRTHVVFLEQIVRGGRRRLGQARRDERLPVALLAAVLAPPLDRLSTPPVGRRRRLTVVGGDKLQECLACRLKKRGRRSKDLSLLIINTRLVVVLVRVRLR